MLDIALPLPAIVFGIWKHINLVKWHETLNNVPCLLIQNAVQYIACHSKMLIILLNIFYFSRYIMKVRHQVEIWTSQEPKKENHLKTRVNPCPRSHQERKKRQKISVLKKRFNYKQLVQTKLWTTSVNILGIRRCIQKSQDSAHNTQVACSSRVSR